MVLRGITKAFFWDLRKKGMMKNSDDHEGTGHTRQTAGARGCWSIGDVSRVSHEVKQTKNEIVVYYIYVRRHAESCSMTILLFVLVHTVLYRYTLRHPFSKVDWNTALVAFYLMVGRYPWVPIHEV